MTTGVITDTGLGEVYFTVAVVIELSNLSDIYTIVSVRRLKRLCNIFDHNNPIIKKQLKSMTHLWIHQDL